MNNMTCPVMRASQLLFINVNILTYILTANENVLCY